MEEGKECERGREDWRRGEWKGGNILSV